jgi:hypothetical protein
MMFSPRNGSSPQKNHRGVGTAANPTLVAEEFTVASSSATQAQGVALIIREPHAVLLELNHRFTDSWQQLMILSILTRILTTLTHDSRRHGLTEIIREFVNLGDSIDITWLGYTASNNLDDEVIKLVLGDNSFDHMPTIKSLGDMPRTSGLALGKAWRKWRCGIAVCVANQINCRHEFQAQNGHL